MNRLNSLALLTVAGLCTSLSLAQPPAPTAPPAAPQPAPAVQPHGQVPPPPNAPTTPPAGVPDPNAKPPLEFESRTFEFGTVPDDGLVKHVFKFKNVTDKTINVTNVQVSCGCTSAPLNKKIYAPGEAGEIEVTFNPTNRRGAEVKHVTVSTDYPAFPAIELTFGVTVKPRVVVEPTSLMMGEVRKGTPGKFTFHVTGRNPDFDIVGEPQFNDPAFTLARVNRMELEQDGEKVARITFELTLLPTTPISSRRPSITLTTNDPNRPTITVPIIADIVGDLRILPDRVPLRFTRPGEKWTREVRIEARGAMTTPFEITSLDAQFPNEMNVTLDIEPLAADAHITGYRLRASGNGPMNPSAVSGKVLVHTNIPDQDVVTVEFFGSLIVATPQPTNPSQPVQQPQPAAATPH